MQGRLVNKVADYIQAFPINDWELEITIAKKNNLKYIELTADYFDYQHNPIFSSEKLLLLKSLLELNNIKPIACTADYFMHIPPWKLNNKNELAKLMHKNISSLANINSSILVIPLVDNSSIKNEKELIFIIDFLLEFTETLDANNVQIAFESDFNPLKLKEFIQNFPSNFGINYDIGNSASLGYDPTDEINSYGERIIHVHVKDRKYRGSTVRLGEGDAEFIKVVTLLSNINYKGSYTLQTARSKKEEHVKEIIQNKVFFEKILEVYS